MNNKIGLLILVFFLYSCGSNRSIVRVSVPASKRVVVQVNKKKTTPPKKQAAKPKETKTAQTSNPVLIEQRYEAAIEQNKSSDNSTVVSKSEILEATTKVKVTTEMVLAYIDQFDEIAKSNMKQYGIPASIILGQGILESGAGTGPLSVLANNHFGIKCHKEWTGPSVKYDDDAAQECFRKYEQSNQSYQDHALFLTSRPRYKGLFELEKGDYKQWALGLKAAGYATDPKYPEKLTGIIERYQLQKYDAEVLGIDYVPTNVTTPSSALVQAGNTNTYTVMPGDTLYSISKKFNLSVDELRAVNGLTDNTLSIGQTLQIN
jgi:flagellum-specific peptidoglycan hydrolase FlgJ